MVVTRERCARDWKLLRFSFRRSEFRGNRLIQLDSGVVPRFEDLRHLLVAVLTVESMPYAPVFGKRLGPADLDQMQLGLRNIFTGE